MVKMRDPRIVGAGLSDADKMAVDTIQAEQMMKANPLFGVVQELEKRVKLMTVQGRTENIRMQALMDYLAHVGLLVHQDVDDEGQVIGDPYSPQEFKLFETLVEAGIIEKMPTYGFTAFYVEHNERIMFLVDMMGQVQQGVFGMERVIEMVRAFNEVPNRIVPITGHEFGLDHWLTANPAGLPDEECDALAFEFGLVKGDDGEEKKDGAVGSESVESADAEGEQNEEATVLPFKKPVEGKGDDEAGAS